mmetsp:Transcript_45120/g.141347  ORF Transcript_45120/g.141347 Transcript_45120/m.141347 type:complete len:269 (+) Transcript_45120:33-839(+)
MWGRQRRPRSGYVSLSITCAPETPRVFRALGSIVLSRGPPKGSSTIFLGLAGSDAGVGLGGSGAAAAVGLGVWFGLGLRARARGGGVLFFSVAPATGAEPEAAWDAGFCAALPRAAVSFRCSCVSALTRKSICAPRSTSLASSASHLLRSVSTWACSPATFAKSSSFSRSAASEASKSSVAALCSRLAELPSFSPGFPLRAIGTRTGGPPLAPPSPLSSLSSPDESESPRAPGRSQNSLSVRSLPECSLSTTFFPQLTRRFRDGIMTA